MSQSERAGRRVVPPEKGRLYRLEIVWKKRNVVKNDIC